MNNGNGTPAQEALLRVIAAKRGTDPLIGAKLGGKEVFARLTEAMKTERGVHIESLLCILGALAGYACQASARATGPRLIVVNGADGKRYYFGDAVNKLLAEHRHSVWSLSAGAAQSVGCKTLPDIAEIFQHVTKTVGGPEFGIPRTAGHQPGDLPVNVLKALWPKFLPLLKSFCAGPIEWPILFGISIQEAIKIGKDSIDPAEALRLVMECAIPMSKVDLDSIAEQVAAVPSNHSTTTKQRVATGAAGSGRSTSPASRATALQHEADADDSSEQSSRKLQIGVKILMGIILLPILYYAVFVLNFVPSKQWREISVGVGIVLSLLFTVALGIGLVRNNVFEQFSAMRVLLSLLAGFFIFAWLFYMGCNYVVGDLVARNMGEPVSMPARVSNYDSSKRWSCSPRLAGASLGRSECISRELHKALPRTVDVTIEARKSWMGYAITQVTINKAQQDDAARLIAELLGSKASPSTAPPNQRCPFLKQTPLATTPPELPANGDKYRLEARQQYVNEATNASSFQDAVFAIHFFNSEVNGYASDPPTPGIEPVEIFETVNEAKYRETLCRASAVMTSTAYVGAAYQGYKDASSPEEAMARMRREHPGFSEHNYDLVRDRSTAAMR